MRKHTEKAKIGGYKPDRKTLLKKAIKEAAKYHRVGKNSYYKLTNHQLLVYMLQNRMGVSWITEKRIRIMRSNLPKSYREKIED